MCILCGLWQVWTFTGATVKGLLPAQLFAANNLILPAALLLASYPAATAFAARCRVLHFNNPLLEERYMLWSNAGKLFVDIVLQLAWFVIGACIWLRVQYGVQSSLAGLSGLATVALMVPLLPPALVLYLRREMYIQHREMLMVAARVCFTAALMYMHNSSSYQLHRTFPVLCIALAQLTATACMSVRLSVFMPLQVIHLLLVLGTTGSANVVFNMVQLFGFGLCLPCLLLYSMEVYARKAFLAAFWPQSPKVHT